MSEISSNEEIFKQSVPIYEKPLKDSGFNDKCVYNPDEVLQKVQEKFYISYSFFFGNSF